MTANGGVLPVVGDELLLSVPRTEQVLARVQKEGPGFYDLELLEAPTTPQRKLERLALMIEFINDEGVARLHGRLDVPHYRRDDTDGESGRIVRFAHRGSPQLLNRRKHVRAAVALPLDLRSDDEVPVVSGAQALDLSGGGLLADGVESPRLGQILAFTLQLESGEPIEGRCEVVRIIDQAKVGLCFTEIDEDERRLLIAFAFEKSRDQRRRMT